ncbi:MAG: GIY-YIG nuclease family protein [SAR202 cluster bacterium]|jgi:sugar fermentation stimulation protein A|nr:GIY-YIG nuclease family protein [SAR202 cluster bacterium]MDP6714043.1 GIY-YIG nuclease family protein [SAR202 cluster bacterium]
MQYRLAEAPTENASKLGPGVYGVMFELDNDQMIVTGMLGEISYPRGWYVYVGSAMGGLSGRLQHHLGPHRKPHWHIDHLLPKGRPVAVVALETDQKVECDVALRLRERFTAFRRFGSSDCRCPGHLFASDAYQPLLDSLMESFKSSGRMPRVIEVIDGSPG